MGRVLIAVVVDRHDEVPAAQPDPGDAEGVVIREAEERQGRDGRDGEVPVAGGEDRTAPSHGPPRDATALPMGLHGRETWTIGRSAYPIGGFTRARYWRFFAGEFASRCLGGEREGLAAAYRAAAGPSRGGGALVAPRVPGRGARWGARGDLRPGGARGGRVARGQRRARGALRPPRRGDRRGLSPDRGPVRAEDHSARREDGQRAGPSHPCPRSGGRLPRAGRSRLAAPRGPALSRGASALRSPSARACGAR